MSLLSLFFTSLYFNSAVALLKDAVLIPRVMGEVRSTLRSDIFVKKNCFAAKCL